MHDSYSATIKRVGSLGILVAAGVIYWIQSDHKQPPLKSQDLSHASFVPLPGANTNERNSTNSIKRRLGQAKLGFTADQWLEAIRQTQGEERDRLLREIIEACYDSRYEFAPIACEFATLLAKTEPGPALRFLANIHGLPGVTSVERKLTGEWMATRSEEAFSYLQTISTEDSMVPIGQLAMISSLGQIEQPEIFEKYSAWIHSMNGDATRDLRNGAMQALVETSETGSFRQVGDLLKSALDDPFLASLAGTLASRQVIAQPDEAIDWVKSLPSGEIRTATLENLFYALAQSHPDKAVELINGNTLAEFASGSTGTPEQLHDQVLSQFLEGLVGTTPDYALQCIPSLHDPALREKYQKLAQEMINSSAALELELLDKAKSTKR